jgi:hypothetical protein
MKALNIGDARASVNYREPAFRIKELLFDELLSTRQRAR